MKNRFIKPLGLAYCFTLYGLISCSSPLIKNNSSINTLGHEFKDHLTSTQNNENNIKKVNFFKLRENKIVPYPPNYLTMTIINDEVSQPFICAYGTNANGDFRIISYGSYCTYEMGPEFSPWIVQTVYKRNDYMTSEGVTVGTSKKDTIKAYQKYGISEHKISSITEYALPSLDIVLKGVDLADTYLYVDNKRIFEKDYSGIDYWGGLGAYIFIIDSNDVVTRIVSFAPTSN